MSATFYPKSCMPDKKKFVPLAYTQDPAHWARSDPMAKQADCHAQLLGYGLERPSEQNW